MRTRYVQDKGDGPLDLFGGIAGWLSEGGVGGGYPKA